MKYPAESWALSYAHTRFVVCAVLGIPRHDLSRESLKLTKRKWRGEGRRGLGDKQVTCPEIKCTYLSGQAEAFCLSGSLATNLLIEFPISWKMRKRILPLPKNNQYSSGYSTQLECMRHWFKPLVMHPDPGCSQICSWNTLLGYF